MKTLTHNLITLTLSLLISAPALAAPTLKMMTPSQAESVKTFHLEPTLNLSSNGIGDGLYISFGDSARFKFGLIHQSYTENHAQDPSLEVKYMKIPVLLEISNSSAPYYTHLGLFYAMPYSAVATGDLDYTESANNLFGLELETGFIFRGKVASFKLGFTTQGSFNSVTSTPDFHDSNYIQVGVATGVSFSM